jgi:hypothetical protein
MGEKSINQKPTCDMLVKHVEVGYMHLSITFAYNKKIR